MAHGSIRSAKTTAQIIKYLRWVADAPPGPLAVVGRTRDTIGRNILDVIAQLDPRAIQWRAGAPSCVIMGRLHHVLGANDSQAETKVRGLTLAGALVDEVTLVSEDFFTTLLGRLSVEGARLFGTTNPDSPAHWFKTKFLDRAHELGWSVWHFTMVDNPGLSDAYRERMAKEYTGLYYDRFIEGAWVAAEGAIYDMWDKGRHVADPSTFPAMDRVLCLGLDYGDVHATRGYMVGVGPDPAGGHKLYVLAEWAPPDGTIGQQSARLGRWVRDLPDPAWRDPAWVAVDGAAASFRRQLITDGEVGNVRNAHKSVLSGIRTVASLLAVDKLVVADTCTHLIDRLPGYVWDDKATKRGETAPVKSDDDEVDALRYAIYTSRMDWRHLIPLAPADEGRDEYEQEAA